MVIRRCRRDDLDALEWDGEFTHDRHIIDWTFARAQERRMVMLVAVDADTIVGQVWIDLGRWPDVAYLWALRVKPRWQGRGVGSRLLRAAEPIARARGATAVDLDVEVTNHAARRLYERLGYHAVRRELVAGAPHDGMRKALPRAARAEGSAVAFDG